VRRAVASAFLEQLDAHPYAEGLAEQPVLPLMLKEARAAAAAPAVPLTAVDADADLHPVDDRQQTEQQPKQRRSVATAAAPPPSIRVLCRTPGQVEAALQVGWLREIILDFLEVREMMMIAMMGGGGGFFGGCGGAASL